MIRGLSGTAIAEDEAGMGDEDDGEGQGEVKDLEHGVKQGGKVRMDESPMRKCKVACFFCVHHAVFV